MPEFTPIFAIALGTIIVVAPTFGCHSSQETGQNPTNRLHPAAIPNSHAPGDVDEPSLVPYIVTNPDSLPGLVIDETDAVLEGDWQYSTHTPPYVGAGYLHDQKSGKGSKSVTYYPQFSRSGFFELRLAHCYNVRRSTNTLIQIKDATGIKSTRINQQQVPEHDRLFRSIGIYEFNISDENWVRISNEGTERYYVIADAIQFLWIGQEHTD